LAAKATASLAGTRTRALPCESTVKVRPVRSAHLVGGAGRVVTFDGLAAVVDDAPQASFDLDREQLLAHGNVLEEAMSIATVLPVAFGTVASGGDEEVREELLRNGSEALHEDLAYVRNRVELDLRVAWKRERLFSEVATEDPEIRALRDEIARTRSGSAYHKRIQLGQLTERAIGDKSDAEATKILDVLEPLAVETSLMPPLTDTMVLNAAFLVERTAEPVFDDAVRELDAEFTDRMLFRYVGPLPPYNFAGANAGGEE